MEIPKTQPEVKQKIKVRHKLGGTNEVFADTLIPMVDGEVWKFGNIIIDSQEQIYKENRIGSDQLSSVNMNLTNNSSDPHTKDYGHKDLIDKDYDKQGMKYPFKDKSIGLHDGVHRPKFVKEKENEK